MTVPITCFTALIDIAEDEQCEELEEYLSVKGATITSTSDTELLPRLQHIIDHCDVVFEQKDIQQQELEGFFYSVVSLFHITTPDQASGIVQSLCDKIASGENQENIPSRIKLLGLMLCHFPIKDPLRYVVFCSLVRLTGRTGQTNALSLNIDMVCRWTDLWQLEITKKRILFMLLWEAYQTSPDVRLTSRILIELMKTYSDSDSNEADLKLIERLIVLVISDPKQFVFDHLLSLAPVVALRSQNIFRLLNIFVSERLSSFQSFYKDNTDFVTGLGLNQDYCVAKMRQLTLVSLAMENQEISFSLLLEQLDLPLEDLEMFVINAVRLNLIEARINQTCKKIIIRTSIYRTFDLCQWTLLHDRLLSWQKCVSSVKSKLKTIQT